MNKNELIPIKVSLVDDHNMFREGIAKVLNNDKDYNVLFEVEGGKEFLDCIKKHGEPEIAIIDIHMKDMSGFELADTLSTLYPDIKVIALSMLSDESAILRMLRHGVKGYLTKDFHLMELKEAIKLVAIDGFYNNNLVTNALLNKVKSPISKELKPTEIRFLEYCCSEMNYREIAKRMFLSTRTIHGYRDKLCKMLNVSTRIGLVKYAFENGIYHYRQKYDENQTSSRSA